MTAIFSQKYTAEQMLARLGVKPNAEFGDYQDYIEEKEKQIAQKTPLISLIPFLIGFLTGILLFIQK